MFPSALILSLPYPDPSRKNMISGSANVKSASSRLRQYSRSWERSSRRSSLIRRRSPPSGGRYSQAGFGPPQRQSRHGLQVGIASDASLLFRLHQREVDLLEARLAHLEPLELLAPLHRGRGQLLEYARRLGRLQDEQLAPPPGGELRGVPA